MKLRKSLAIAFVMFSALGFTACSDESENILPTPVEEESDDATVGHGGQQDDLMD